ncbi:hypothetical protein SNEBB_011125 [Seison nebaliae]|nr:hypothetical protein SNEBB_011125 [Seison nebaliae]
MKQSQEDVDQLLTRRSWDMALAPAKQLPMNMLFLWMTGDSISFIPIMMIGMVFYQCIQSFFQIPATFKAISEGLANAWPQKIIYVLSKIALFIFTLYKFNSMGLLPIYMSDWLAFAVKQESLEMSFL